MAKGSEHANSDIELMLVTGVLSYTELMEALSVAEKQLGRSINPTIYNKQEMHMRIKQKQSFITRVLSQNMLWLKGGSLFKETYNKELK